MSLHYLLDGYNILHQMPLDVQGSLEHQGALQDQRGQLIQWLEVHRPQGSVKNAVTIVFDGKSGILGGPSLSSSMKVIFSQDESADGKIKSLVAQAPNKKSIVVVTNDKDVKFAVRALGAKVMGVQDFLSNISSPPLSKKGSLNRSVDREGSQKVSTTLEYKITSELEQIWLKSKKSKPSAN